MAQLEIFNGKEKFPKLLVENIETKEIFKLIGGISLKNEDKIVLEGENTTSKIVCLFSTFKKNYKVIGYYD